QERSGLDGVSPYQDAPMNCRLQAWLAPLTLQCGLAHRSTVFFDRRHHLRHQHALFDFSMAERISPGQPDKLLLALAGLRFPHGGDASTRVFLFALSSEQPL